MKNVIKFLMVAVIVILVSSCNSIDGNNCGEHTVVYYGNIAGVELVAGNCGYVLIDVDVDADGSTDFKVVLPNSYINDVKIIGDNFVELLVISAWRNSWSVVDVITQPNIQDFLNFEEEPDTTKIIVK